MIAGFYQYSYIDLQISANFKIVNVPSMFMLLQGCRMVAKIPVKVRARVLCRTCSEQPGQALNKEPEAGSP